MALSRHCDRICGEIISFFALLSYLFVLVTSDIIEETGLGYYKLEGKVYPPDNEPENWLTSTKVLVNGGDYLGFIRVDGYFVVSGMSSGSYVVEVANANYSYEPARVEINSKGKIRARKLNLLQSSTIMQIPYPLKFKPRGKFNYFQMREQWRITDFLFSPMVFMMVLPLLLIMVMPKLMNAAGPETQREMQQSLQSPNFDMPDFAETLTSWFDGGKKSSGTSATKSIRANKKRQ